MKKLQKIALSLGLAAIIGAAALPAYAAEKPVTLPAPVAQLPGYAQLPAPANLTAETVSFDKIQSTDPGSVGVSLAWKKVAGAVKYYGYLLNKTTGKYVRTEETANDSFGDDRAFIAYAYYKDYKRAGFRFLPDTEYKIKVAAVDKNGKTGTLSEAVSFKTPKFSPPVTVKDKDSNYFQTLATQTAVVFNFAETAWADSYELAVLLPGEKDYRPLKSSDTVKADSKNLAGITYTVTGLKADTSYSFKIRAAGSPDGKEVKTDYSEGFAVKTAKAAFADKTSVALAGNYFTEVKGNFFVFNKDGTGTYTDKDGRHDFTFAASPGKEVGFEADVISDDFLGYVSANKGGLLYLGTFLTPGEDTLISTDSKDGALKLSGTFTVSGGGALEFKKDGTGVARSSVSGEKDAYFTYTRLGGSLVLKFSTTPGTSLKGLAKGEIKGTVYENVTVEESSGDIYTVAGVNGSTVANVKSADDISSKTPASFIVIGDDYSGNVYASVKTA
ncbi:hypothetical protein FACS1894120_0230 [Clostridia bacterium]|nr:hypothetical protein FACS1894120_0230 [Clostridia bacterium]